MEGFYKGKRELVMKGEYNWETKGKSGACRATGQFIKDGEPYYLVVVNGQDFSKMYPKEGNFIIKKDVFDELLEKHAGNGDAAIIELFSKKQPPAKNRTPINEEMTEKMREILRLRNFYIHKETKDKLYFKYDRTDSSAGFMFDKRSLRLENRSRRKKGLLGGMVETELMSRLREELLELPEGYRVGKVMKQATDMVNQMMGQ